MEDWKVLRVELGSGDRTLPRPQCSRLLFSKLSSGSPVRVNQAPSSVWTRSSQTAGPHRNGHIRQDQLRAHQGLVAFPVAVDSIIQALEILTTNDVRRLLPKPKGHHTAPAPGGATASTAPETSGTPGMPRLGERWTRPSSMCLGRVIGLPYRLCVRTV